jgi:hypothetical protein
MRKQVELWRQSELTDVTAKMIIYQAFIESELEVRGTSLFACTICICPQYDEFQPRTVWSLSNAFTSAFKDLDPIPQFRATSQGRWFSRSLFQAELLRTTEGLAVVSSTCRARGRNARF